MRYMELGHFVRRLYGRGGKKCRTQVAMKPLCVEIIPSIPV